MTQVAKQKKTKNKMARVGKIPAILSTNATGVAVPDNSNFVFVYFESDTDKLCVKKSDATVVKTIAMLP